MNHQIKILQLKMIHDKIHSPLSAFIWLMLSILWPIKIVAVGPIGPCVIYARVKNLNQVNWLWEDTKSKSERL